ncbi:unnamed protein product [Symbiodinium pilosum]|uniref:Uncharacterized protein n=1 Tax=Symbiodinium pilosum TaxID=2952 RepID=A0A812P3C8_SYMPI|nr:unnamed protein product [Symbiodinium pilosum]
MQVPVQNARIGMPRAPARQAAQVRSLSPAVSSRANVTLGTVRIVQSPQASHVPMSFQAAPKPLAAPRMSLQQPVPLLPQDEMAAWLRAARDFVTNTDFDVGPFLDRKRNITELMNIMKANSGGKGTIQALGDKIILSKLLENLGVPQMPVLLSTYTKVDKAEVEKLVSSWTRSSDPEVYDVVIKPTHLSSAMGAVIMSKAKWDKEQWSAQKLIEHMETYLEKKAADSESEALKSLIPGFIIQPRYRSSVGFNFPLELRVVTIWGKARVGIWWWGRVADPKGRRTTWLVRVPKVSGKLSDDDDWEVIHEHGGHNRGFEVSLKLFREAMPAMSAAAEGIATGVGAPFLRSDFFVGSAEWGVRLNEVAYGSGVDYKRRLRGGTSKHVTSASGGAWVGGLVDDGPAIAEILQEGFKLCQRKPPAEFLKVLGARTALYEVPTRGRPQSVSKPIEPMMKVEAVPPEKRCRQLPEDAVRDLVGLYKSPGNMLSQTGCCP